jgi:ubiquinone/menaquinone biosynthesis C-methylase UbiE
MREGVQQRLNLDSATVEGFGREWARFDQSALPREELHRYFDEYFSIFPWQELPANASGLDVGCGSGRWALFVSERVGKLHCIDASEEALSVARRNLASRPNCVFHHASLDNLNLPDASLDFGYSLGVLHHIPDTAAGLRACVAKLKPGAPFMLYVYYAFDNRPAWFRAMWRLSDFARRRISHLPPRTKTLFADLIAGSVYFPLARAARLAEKYGLPVESFPLSYYREASFYTMRTDALDRFGTRLEQRFTADEIREMMLAAGLERIRFREGPPHWCALGFRRAT